MTKEIELKDGIVVIVDDDDYENVSNCKWYLLKNRDHMYAIGKVNGKFMYLHRFIMEPENGMVVDHINRSGLDCRKENMRVCTNSQNMMNSKSFNGKSHKYKGIEKHRNKWRARIAVSGKLMYLGSFETAKEAAEAYDKKAIETYGEYARTNKMEGLL